MEEKNDETGFVENAENKLIVLYLINSLQHSPVSHIELIKKVYDYRIMNFFILQNALSGLISSGFILVRYEDEQPVYTMLPEGKNILALLSHKIPESFKRLMERIISEMKQTETFATQVLTDVKRSNYGQYTAHIQIKEGPFTLFEVKMSASQKEDAIKICENFKKNSHIMFPQFISMLTKEPSGSDK